MYCINKILSHTARRLKIQMQYLLNRVIKKRNPARVIHKQTITDQG